MRIEAENIGKKYKNEWIFRNLSIEITSDSPLAIIGPNGSGKSTLMQSLSGMIPLNEGKVRYSENNQSIDEENWHQNLTFSSPYLELIEEFTLEETVKFHQKFKSLENNIVVQDFLEIIDLKKHAAKQVKNFSSGMRQKLKLGLAFYSTSKAIFLDEPTANLDHKAFDWYLEQIKLQIKNKIVLVSSNEPKEYTFCQKSINISDYKNIC